MNDIIKNRRLGRAADYKFKEENKVILWTLDMRNDLDQLVGEVTREEAHRWMHGQELTSDNPTIAPTFDEMIEVVAAQLKVEMALYMEWALDNEGSLQSMYRACGTQRQPLHVGNGKFRLTRAKW